jgi:hypothetical protein
MFLYSFSCRFQIDVVTADHIETARFIRWDMTIVDDSTAANEGNAVINLRRQLALERRLDNRGQYINCHMKD